jgi:hypothetical protein
MDCPRIVANRVPLEQIPAAVRSRRALKFSPGLPQNETCGCWRANRTVDVTLNASWIVSGLTFGSTRVRWLSEIAVQASDDNATFLDWGTYSAPNYTASALAIFAYPIRARFFRITVLRYVNHMVNSTDGMELGVGALVSQTQPFGCACRALSSGHCCPFANMTVRNDTCVWCTDPSLLSTVVIDGCGRCKPGYFEHLGRCVLRRVANAINNLDVQVVRSDGVYWTVALELTLDGRTDAVLRLFARGRALTILQTAGGSLPSVSNQYLQFDRGRGALNMTREAVRSWADCAGSLCTGTLMAEFSDPNTQPLNRSLVFELGLTALVGVLHGTRYTALAHIEVHFFADTGTWALRITGIRLSTDLMVVDWGSGAVSNATGAFGEDYVSITPPPASWDSLRVTDGITSLRAEAPVRTVVHGATMYTEHSGIDVKIRYGFGLAAMPAPGDSEQVVLVTARSPQPIRLRRLSTTLNGITVIYTTAKGFILDQSRVLDLSIACTQPRGAMQNWIVQAIGILPDAVPGIIPRFVEQCCALATAATRSYWMIPIRAIYARRDVPVQMQVTAVFS